VPVEVVERAALVALAGPREDPTEVVLLVEDVDT
jgi:hypothetical protein